jgi:hypothetical protein
MPIGTAIGGVSVSRTRTLKDVGRIVWVSIPSISLSATIVAAARLALPHG